MTRTFTDQVNGLDPDRPVCRTTWPARAFVLGGPALAAVCTAVALGLDVGAEHIGPLWMAAIAWTVFANLAGALWREFCHGDWCALSGYELPEDDGEMDEWLSRTGRYSWLGDMELGRRCAAVGHGGQQPGAAPTRGALAPGLLRPLG